MIKNSIITNYSEQIRVNADGKKYTDEEIRKFQKITCKIAADYLGYRHGSKYWNEK